MWSHHDVLCAPQKEELRSVEKEKEARPKDNGPALAVDISHDDLYFPSIDLLTAQVHLQKATIKLTSIHLRSHECGKTNVLTVFLGFTLVRAA